MAEYRVHSDSRDYDLVGVEEYQKLPKEELAWRLFLAQCDAILGGLSREKVVGSAIYGRRPWRDWFDEPVKRRRKAR